MADEARLHDLLDLVEQARKEGNKDIEAQATAAYRRESMPDDVRASHENRLVDATGALQAEQNKSAPTSVLHKALTAADLSLAGASGVATPVLAGASGMIATALKNAGMNTDPARVRQTILDRGYKTHDGYGADAGAALSSGIADTLAPVVGPVVAGNKAVMSHLSPEWQGKLKDLEGLAGDTLSVAPVAGQVGRSLVRTLAAAAPSQVVAESAPAIARAAGLNVSPSATNALAGAGERAGRFRRVMEGVGGEPAGHADNIVRNRPVITDIALQDVGMPPQYKIPNTVTGLQDTLALAAKPFEATYQKVRDLLGPGSVPVDGLADEISQIGRGTDSLAKVPASVEALKAHYSQLPPMSGSQLLDTMTDLRKSGYKALLSDDPETAAVGNAQISIAKLLEKRLSAVADQAAPGLSGEFKAARTGFAKLYTADAARVGNDIDPQAIRKIGERAGTNTGGMQLIEHMATHFEPDLQLKATPTPFGSQVVRGSLITGGGAAGAAVGGPVGAALGAAAPVVTQKLARALVRATNGAESVPQIRLGRSLERYYGERPTAAPQAHEGWTASDPMSSPRPSAGAPDYASVLAGDLKLGDHAPSGLSLAPEQTHFPKTADLSGSEASRLSQDLSLAGEHGSGPHMNLSDHAGVMSQGVPEGIVARAARAAKLASGDFYDPTKIDPSLDEIIAKLRGE